MLPYKKLVYKKKKNLKEHHEEHHSTHSVNTQQSKGKKKRKLNKKHHRTPLTGGGSGYRQSPTFKTYQYLKKNSQESDSSDNSDNTDDHTDDEEYSHSQEAKIQHAVDVLLMLPSYVYPKYYRRTTSTYTTNTQPANRQSSYLTYPPSLTHHRISSMYHKVFHPKHPNIHTTNNVHSSSSQSSTPEQNQSPSMSAIKSNLGVDMKVFSL